MYVFPPLGAVLGLTVFVPGSTTGAGSTSSADRDRNLGSNAGGAKGLLAGCLWLTTGCQAWAGIVLRRYHLNLQATRRAAANSSMQPTDLTTIPFPTPDFR
jgi:hypothetical protein